MVNDHGWMVTINVIQTYLNIDELELDGCAFLETSAQWLDYNINNNFFYQTLVLNVGKRPQAFANV